MAAPNYSGEKRRKDLAKIAKKKEKLAKKLEKGRASREGTGNAPTEPAAEGEA